MITEFFHSVFSAYFNDLIWLKHRDRPFHISCKGALSSRSTRRLKWLLAHTVGPSASPACSRSRCEWLHCCAHSGVQLVSSNWRTIWRRTKQIEREVSLRSLDRQKGTLNPQSITFNIFKEGYFSQLHTSYSQTSTSLTPMSSQCGTSSFLKATRFVFMGWIISWPDAVTLPKCCTTPPRPKMSNTSLKC